MPLLLELPLETLEAIFMSIDDSETLLAALLTCKYFYLIYNVRKHVILPTVVCNALGGNRAIVACLESLRIEAIIPNYSQPSHVDPFFANVRALRQNPVSMPTAEQYKTCFERARICQGLEVLFSRFRKDRLTRNTSRLTRTESDKFCQAVHRIWQARPYMTSVAQHLCMRPSTRAELLYDDYPAQDAYDIHSVLEFMGEHAAECLPDRYAPRLCGVFQLECLFCGPADLLKLYTEPASAPVYLLRGHWDRSSYGVPSDDLLRVFIKHGLLGATTTTLTIPNSIRPIVDPAVHLNLQCWNCREQSGLRLWDVNNWDRPPCDLRLETILDLLPGNLKDNVYERPLLAQYLGISDFHVQFPLKAPRSTQDRLPSIPNVTVAWILQALVDLPHLVNTPSQIAYVEQSGFFSITNVDPLCKTCIRDLVKNRLWILWQAVKVGAAPEEDNKPHCWHGFNCTSQFTNPEHSFRMNHACPETFEVL